MTAPKIISRQETIAFVRDWGLAAVAGVPRPQPPAGDFMRAVDIEAGVEALMRVLAEHMDKIPDGISTDVETQEAVRVEIDRTMSRIVVMLRQQIVQLRCGRGNKRRPA